jgi:hypothetical protein
LPLASDAAVWNKPGVQTGFSPANPERFAAAIRRFDDANSRDPNVEVVNGQSQPRELRYAQWLTDWVLKLAPDASEALRLAARCQHICRWESPRDSYPMDKPGYLKWRADLKKFHAEKSGQILREVGYDEAMVQRVQELNLKKKRKLAERGGFEPPIRLLTVYRFSKPAPSATRPPLHRGA